RTGGRYRHEDASPAGVGHCSAAPRSAGLAGGGWLDVDIAAAEVEDARRSHLLRGVVYCGRGAAVRVSGWRRAGCGLRVTRTPRLLRGIGHCRGLLGVSQTASWMSTSRLP